MCNTEAFFQIQFYRIRCFPTFYYPTNLCHVVTGSQRLSEEGQRSPDVEVHVRVPLEKEVPLTLVIEETKPLEEKPEFPELTKVWSLCLNEYAGFTMLRIYLDEPAIDLLSLRRLCISEFLISCFFTWCLFLLRKWKLRWTGH